MFISNTVFIAALGLGLSYLANRHGNFNLLNLILEKFVPFYIVLAVLFFVYVALMQLAIKLVRGKGSLDKTFMVICYSFSPINFASWLFFLAFTENIYASSSLMELPFWLGLLASILYIFYLLVVGISVTSDIPRGRALAALIIQLSIIVFTPIILTYAPAFFYQNSTTTLLGYSYTPYPTPSVTPFYEKYSTDTQSHYYSKNASSKTPESHKPETEADSYEPEPIKYDITVFAGSTPNINGIKDGKDAWYEGDSVRTAIGGSRLTITTKHDFNNIYILMELNGQPSFLDRIMIYFALNESVPGIDIISGDAIFIGRVSYYYLEFFNTDYLYNRFNNMSDNIKGTYKNGVFILEWQVPMKSGNVDDIYIDKFPTQVYFSVRDLKNDKNIWPPNTNPYKPDTWGNMTIVRERAR